MGTEVNPIDIDAAEDFAAQQAQREKLRAQMWEDDIRWLMSDKRGRRFVARILEFTGPDRSTFRNSDRDQVYAEGVRNVGLWVRGEVDRIAPHRLIELHREYQAR